MPKPFHSDKVRELYDLEMRRDFDGGTNFTAEPLPRVTRLTGRGPAAGCGAIIYSRLDSECVDSLIGEQIQYFRKAGLWFEWKLYEHDRPGDLGDRLAARGLSPGESEALVALDLSEPPRFEAPHGIEIRKVSEVSELPAITALNEVVWKRDASDLIAELTEEMTTTPEAISIYFARAAGVPVSVGWIRFHEGKHFADLWGGQTLPEFRKRGIYKALVSTRAEEARRRGFSYLTVDAMPMSRPILESMGFELVAQTVPYLWLPN